MSAMSRARRGGATSALCLVSVLLLGGCWGELESPKLSDDPTPAASQTTGPATPTPEASAAGDTSITDFLEEAGIDDVLVNGLGEVADANGYGIDADTATTSEQRRGFAVVQVGTCRDVAEGNQTWAGVRIEDMENGASETQAAAMVTHLRTVFCPGVAP
ncbi:hypothetical protein ACWGQ4_14280 [Streptomyces sp. NPDC055721]|uniref:hypothetical protein n=1 Tax=Streptomyces sp. NPDC127132 TaxID=3345374 RepID=UPI00363407DF